MNELIERLARAATIEWQESPTHCVFEEIFAKAVAKECAEIAEHKYLAEEVNQAIRERFGLD